MNLVPASPSPFLSLLTTSRSAAVWSAARALSREASWASSVWTRSVHCCCRVKACCCARLLSLPAAPCRGTRGQHSLFKRGLILLLRSKNGCLIEKLSFLNFSSLSTAEIPTCRLCLLTQALACSGAGVWDQSWYWRFSFRHQSVLRHSPPSPYSVLLSMAEAFPWEAA